MQNLKDVDDALLEAMDALYRVRSYIEDGVDVNTHIQPITIAIQDISNARDKLQGLQQTPITQVLMEAAGAQHIHFNPNYNGGFHAWWLLVSDEQDERQYARFNNHRLMVTFGEYKQHPVLVWLEFPGTRYAFEKAITYLTHKDNYHE